MRTKNRIQLDIVYTYYVRNVTLSINEDLLERGREHARIHGTTLNQLIRDLLEREVSPTRGLAIRQLFEHARQLGTRSSGTYLSRDEAHERH